jgi:hypothetical protein
MTAREKLNAEIARIHALSPRENCLEQLAQVNERIERTLQDIKACRTQGTYRILNQSLHTLHVLKYDIEQDMATL